MKIQIKAFIAVAFATACLPCLGATKAKGDPLCPPLRAFVASVKKDESKTLEFHTSWGTASGIRLHPTKSSPQKWCTFSDYGPARPVCDYLMEHGAIEFSGNNAKSAIACLSPATRFSPRIELDRVDASFYYGTESRGSNIRINFVEDSKLGGMVLTIKANGY